MPTTAPPRPRRPKRKLPANGSPLPAAPPPILSGHHAVYLAAMPESFRPTGFREVPPRIHGATLLAAGLDQDLAAAFARVYNERALETRPGPATWAVVVELPDVPDFGSAKYRNHQAHYRKLLEALRRQA